MITLTQTNPYLRDPARRRAMLEANARQSSLFEGTWLPVSRRALYSDPSIRRAIASAKKTASGS